MKRPFSYIFMFKSGLNWNPIGPVVSKVLFDPTERLPVFRLEIPEGSNLNVLAAKANRDISGTVLGI